MIRRTRAHALLLLALGLSACRDGGEPPLVAEDVMKLNDQANQVVFGLTHFMTSEGLRRARVEADTAFYLENQSLIELRNMTVVFFDAVGDTTTVLTAKMGTYDWNSGDMLAEQDVVVISPREGRRVETSILHFNRAEDRIWGDEYTKMWEADGTVVEGTSFETNSRMDAVNLTAPRMVSPETAEGREK